MDERVQSALVQLASLIVGGLVVAFYLKWTERKRN